MKKNILTTALISTIVLAGATTASAAEVQKDSTSIGIEFEGSGPEIVEGPYKNKLTLVYKPAAFEFGKQKAEGFLKTYDAAEPSNTNYLVVNDNREYLSNDQADADVQVADDVNDKQGGTWVLKAQMDELKSGANTLPATLKMKLGTIKDYEMGNKQNADASDIIPNPATDEFIKDSTIAHGVTLPTPDLTLEAGAAAETPIMTKATATVGQSGVATSVTDVKLTAQATQANAGNKAFTSKVTWTLYTGVL